MMEVMEEEMVAVGVMVGVGMDLDSTQLFN